jgi:two-component system, OmpR family, sensor kinase
MRGRLVAAIVLAAVIVLAGSFYALHEETGADLNSEVDEHLQSDAAEFAASPAAASRTAEQLDRRARRFIDGQGYHGDSRIFAVEVGAGGGGPVTNRPDALSTGGQGRGGMEEPDDDDAPKGMLQAPEGLATIDAPDGGELRVLTEPVGPSDARLGTFRVAQSLNPVGTAQGTLRDTLLVVGIVAAAVLVVAAFWIATLAARPLSRIASFAADLDTSDLDRRLDEEEGPAEVRSLAHSFNRMLDRLQASFGREREFVADASHELRTPVTIAQGELELLRRGADESGREHIDVVRRELRRMERLVGEMLTLAAQDADADMRRDRIEVSDLLADLRRDAPLLGERRYEVGDLGGSVEVDPDRIAQVFRNLLANAVAHTETGGSIRVRARAEGDRVRFEIDDDGAGFDREEAERLFDRFYRTDGGRARDTRGSGLGLAIARSIVEAHGGSIRAVPANGTSGGKVVFDLPGYRA